MTEPVVGTKGIGKPKLIMRVIVRFFENMPLAAK